jgi:NAD-dependent deacetylase
MTKINQLTNLLEQSRNTVFFGGAGVSTESGIPDFRSEAGLQTEGFVPSEGLRGTLTS